MTRNRFMSSLQNWYFTDNQAADKSTKDYKMRIVLNHLNKAFQDAISDLERQSIDEHINKFNVLRAVHEKQANKMGFQVVVSMLQQSRISVWVWSLSWQKGKEKAWAWGNSCFGFVLEIRKYTLCIMAAVEIHQSVVCVSEKYFHLVFYYNSQSFKQPEENVDTTMQEGLKTKDTFSVIHVKFFVLDFRQ